MWRWWIKINIYARFSILKRKIFSLQLAFSRLLVQAFIFGVEFLNEEGLPYLSKLWILGFDFLQYCNSHVCHWMSRFVKVFSSGFFHLSVSDISSVLSESDCQGLFSFADILLFAFVTTKAVNYICRLAVNLLFNVMLKTWRSCYNCLSCLYIGAG